MSPQDYVPDRRDRPTPLASIATRTIGAKGAVHRGRMDEHAHSKLRRVARFKHNDTHGGLEYPAADKH